MRKAAAQRRKQVLQFLDDTRRTRIASRPQAATQQQARPSLEPEELVVHVLVVPPMKERELLRPVGRIIRAVEIEDEIGRMLVRPVGVGTEPIDARASQPLNRGPVDRVLQPRERRLRPEGGASIRRDHLERRVMAEPVSIVDVLVPCGDLIQPLPDKCLQLVRNAPRIASVGDPAHDIGAETELFIEFSDG